MKIKLINKIGKTGFPSADEQNKEVFAQAKAFVEKNNDYLIDKGYRTIEFDTMGGFYSRGKRTGRFVPLTTMHMMRLLKK